MSSTCTLLSRQKFNIICDFETGNKIQYDRNWKELQYLVVTRETAFELTFLEKFDVELAYRAGKHSY